jgi:hypothetical protein
VYPILPVFAPSVLSNVYCLRVVYPAFVSFFLRVVYPILPVFAPSVLSNVYCLRVVYPAFVSFFLRARQQYTLESTEGAKTGKIGYTTRRKNETKAGYTTRRQYTLDSLTCIVVVLCTLPLFHFFFVLCTLPCQFLLLRY